MIEELKRLIKFSLGTWINFLLSMVFAPISTFLVLPEEYGKYALFIVVQNFLVFALGLGLQQSQIRFFHERDPDQMLVSYIGTMAIFFLAAFGLILIFDKSVNLFITESVGGLALPVQLASISFITAINNLGLNQLRMKKQATRYSSIQVLTQVGNYVFFFGYIFFVKPEFHAFIIASLLSSVIQFGLIFFVYLKIHKIVPRFAYEKKIIKDSLIFGLPFVPAFMVDYLFTYSDRYFIRYYGDLASLGVYSLALRFSFAFTILQTGFHTYWAPYSMERFASDPDNRNFYRDVFELLNFLLVTILVAAILFKDLLIYLIDSKFDEVIIYFPFLLFVPVYYTLSEVTFVGINFSKKTNVHLLINLITLGCNALFAFLLIPVYGAAGAAMTCGLTYLCFFLLRSYFGNKFYPQPLSWTSFIVSHVCVIGWMLVNFAQPPSLIVRIGGSITLFALFWFMYHETLKRFLKKLYPMRSA
jgi:O-antigen/teichoic acid export membrane protein